LSFPHLVASWKKFFFETNEEDKREINAQNVTSGHHNHILRWRRNEKRGCVRENRREKSQNGERTICAHSFNTNTTPPSYQLILTWRRNDVFNSWGRKNEDTETHKMINTEAFKT
jgi:hypothetical protein